MLIHFAETQGTNAEDFLNFCRQAIEQCNTISQEIKLQLEFKVWMELRYGRITAPGIYETHCKTELLDVWL